MRYSILVFKGSESIGEFPYSLQDESDFAATEPLRKLKPEFSGVILDGHGVLAHSANLPKDNPWYRPLALQV